MVNVGQRAAVANAFLLAGYRGPLVTAPDAGADERVFLLDADALASLRQVEDLELVLAQLLGGPVWVTARDDAWGAPVPFG